ncbi:cysteine desulfurase family protein [Corynebacterium vitaeruminis]|uniref:cysteine desulfurase family protein n=1 Tax=Corynebacterium vitaeruminis TaxID=38305 RepID=UPI00054F130C|nr:cysteine desulfurase family protein [Corynebacterium vitaeruminis]
MTSYFDHAATSPMRDIARAAWLEASAALNPASQYASGRRSRSLLDAAREKVARLMGCEPIEVVFTSSGTEADNIGVFGQWRARTGGRGGRVVVSAIEHPAVAESARLAGEFGAEVEYLPVGPDGIVSDLSLLDRPASVASCMWANNETGAIQPIEEVVARAKETGTPVHVDAVQVVGKLPIDFQALGATTLAASAHKFGGPRGTGFLLARRSPAPAPVLVGGGQERGIRSGTVDTAGACALAVALEESCTEMAAESARLGGLKEQLRAGILGTIDDVVVHTPENSLASHLYLSFPGAEADSLIMLLDSLGIEASAGSACHNGVNRASETLIAAGVDEKTARSTVRFTMGHTTTEEDVVTVLRAMPDVVKRARLAGMA